MSKWFPIVALAAVLASVGAGTARADHDSPDELLARYQPVVVLDRTERFAPTSVDAFIDAAALERLGDGGDAVEEIPRRELPAHGEGWRLNERGCTPAGGLASLACYAAGTTPSPLLYGR